MLPVKYVYQITDISQKLIFYTFDQNKKKINAILFVLSVSTKDIKTDEQKKLK